MGRMAAIGPAARIYVKTRVAILRTRKLGMKHRSAGKPENFA